MLNMHDVADTEWALRAFRRRLGFAPDPGPPLWPLVAVPILGLIVLLCGYCLGR